jgi:nucleotide-binding universal stress UspA family protein
MNEVLVAVDDDVDRAVAQAEAILNLPWASDQLHVVILHVFGENPEGASVHQLGSVRRARERLEEAGVEVTLDESSDGPSEEILDLARELDVDLISVSGRERSPAGKALLGSVSQEVLLGADRPVLFTKTD